MRRISKKEEIINLINDSLDYYYKQDRAFSFQEILDELHYDICREDLLRIILRDRRFLRFGDLKSNENAYFISHRFTFIYFLQLNIFAYALGEKEIDERLPLEILQKKFLLTELSKKDINKIYNWTAKRALIERKDDGKLHFFLADFFALIQSKLKSNLSELIEDSNLLTIDKTDIEVVIEKIIWEFFQDITPDNRRNAEIFILRKGLKDGHIYTLEQIGQKYKLTRERVRQIVKRILAISIEKIKRDHSLLVCLYLIIIKNYGRRIYSQRDGKDFYRINLISNLFNIPFAYIYQINKWLLAVNEGIAEAIGEVLENSYNKNKILSDLNSIKGLYLRQEDIINIANLHHNYIKEKMKYEDIIYMAMKKIGKPASYTQIATECKHLFPEKDITPRNILAVLSRSPQDKYPWVWTGIRGMYALKEWGYQRPRKSINDEIFEIIDTIYKRTGKPVPFNVIYAEFAKRRKIFNANSFNIALHTDKRLKRAGKDSFMPLKEEESVGIDNKKRDWLDKLDRALRDER